MMYRYFAESWDQFVNDLRTRPKFWGGTEGSSRIDHAGWSGCATWEDAIRYAVTGHPAGRAAIESAAVKVSSQPEPLWDAAPVGVFPCIPAYAAGVPEDMFCPNEDAPPVQSPIVRIAVNMAASARVAPEDIVNRGVAIVSLIDRLQLAGRRVELVAMDHTDHGFGHNKSAWAVTIKRPEESVDMDRIGLCFATPIMLRRFFFRVMEFTVPQEVPAYGWAAHFPEECAGFDLTLPEIKGYEYSTPDAAAKTVAKLWNESQQRAAA